MLKSILIAAALVFAAPAFAQPPTLPQVKPAMEKLESLTGVWKGRAKGTDRAGKAYDIVQTERVGYILDGDVLMIEGRGYEDGGALAFNALALVSFNAVSGKYEFRAYSGGFAGTHRFEPTTDGYVWEMQAGPKATILYTITIKDGTWIETGEYRAEGKPAAKFIELTLKRIGDSDWPAAGAIKP